MQSYNTLIMHTLDMSHDIQYTHAHTQTGTQCIYLYCSQMNNEAIKDVGEKGQPGVKVQLLNGL